jgi:hypothetical protein
MDKYMAIMAVHTWLISNALLPEWPR